MAMTTRYVSPTGAGLHDGSSEANAWSVNEMMANAVAGDHCYYKGSYSKNTHGAINSPTNAGSSSQFIIWEGYNTVPGDGFQGFKENGGLVTTNFPTVNLQNSQINMGAGDNYWEFRSLYITGTGSASYELLDLSGNNYTILRWLRIEATGSNARGVGIYNSSAIIECEISAENSGAVYLTYDDSIIINSRVTAPNAIGIYISRNSFAVNCIVENCNYGIVCAGTQLVILLNNTIANINNSGIGYNQAAACPICIGNSITGCGGPAFDGYNATPVGAIKHRNRTRDNVAADVGQGDYEYIEHVTTDTGGDEQDFSDALNGIYKPIFTSPLTGNGGFEYNDIGALKAIVPTPASGSMDVGETDPALSLGDTSTLLGGISCGISETIGLSVVVQKYVAAVWTTQSTIYSSSFAVVASTEYTFTAINGAVDMTYTAGSTGQYRWLITMTHENGNTETWSAYFEIQALAVFPLEDEVLHPIEYGPNGDDYLGTITLPTEVNVLYDVDYGANGVEFTGRYVPVGGPDDVWEGTSYGVDGGTMGNIHLPDADELLLGVVVGPAGTGGDLIVGTAIEEQHTDDEVIDTASVPGNFVVSTLSNDVILVSVTNWGLGGAGTVEPGGGNPLKIHLKPGK